jgi:hypothetical protein
MHATFGLRVPVAQLLMYYPELVDIYHFIRFYHQQAPKVCSNFMIVLIYAMRLHLDRTTRFHATLANAKKFSYAKAILGVPLAHSSSSKKNSGEEGSGGRQGVTPGWTSVPLRIGSRAASYSSGGLEGRDSGRGVFHGRPEVVFKAVRMVAVMEAWK